jgi:hypothetical protein
MSGTAGRFRAGGCGHLRGVAPTAAPIFALAGGSFIFLGIVVLLFFVIVFAYYTYRGSAINPHPHDGSDAAPGAAAPSEPSGKGRLSEEHPDELSAGGGFSGHGAE